MENECFRGNGLNNANNQSRLGLLKQVSVNTDSFRLLTSFLKVFPVFMVVLIFSWGMGEAIPEEPGPDILEFGEGYDSNLSMGDMNEKIGHTEHDYVVAARV